MSRLAFVIFLTALVTACGTKIDSGNAEGVTVSNTTGGSSAEALQVADEHCKKYGKAARLQQADLPRAGQFAGHWSYTCVRPGS